MARLDILDGPHAGESFTFKDEVFLGRSPLNAIRLSDTSISRRHACITHLDDKFVIEDLRSTNGTLLGKSRLEPRVPHELREGSEIQLGLVRLIFHLDDAGEPFYDPGQGFFNLVTAHPRVFLLASLLVAAVFLAFAPFAKTINNVDYFTLENDREIEFYDSFKSLFGDDEFFVIAFEKENIFTKKYLIFIKEITEQLDSLEETRDVKSLANVDRTIGEEGYFEVKKFLEDIPETSQELEALKAEATTNPLYVKSFISPDARTAAIVVFPYHRPEDSDYRHRLLAKTQAIIEPYRKAGDEFYLAGWTATNFRLSQAMKEDLATFIPVTYLCIAIVVWIIFGSMWITVLAIANISICMGSVMGLFGLTGITINNLTTIAIPLIMALCLSDTVHIFSHMDKRVLKEFPDRSQALASILRHIIFPCFMTSVTTAIGFASLAVSEIISIREFAFIASAGMIFEFFYSFLFMPPLILLVPAEKVYQDYNSDTGAGLTHLLQAIANVIQKYGKAVLLSTVIFSLICGILTTQVKVDTNLLKYFKASNPVRVETRFIEKHLGGVGSLDVSLRAVEIDAFKDPAYLQTLERLQQYVQSLPEVDVTTSLIDFLKDMNRAFHNGEQAYYKLPESPELVAQYLLLYSSDELEHFINSTYDHARLAVRISAHSSAAQIRLMRQLREHIATMPHAGIDIRLTGRTVQEVQVIDALVDSQISSLSLGAGVIGLIMCIVLRSVPMGLLSLLPNIVPIIACFGIMGAVGIPLNNATAMIAAIALGMAVDNNIHFLSEYRDKRAAHLSVPQALTEIIVSKGRAMLSASIILTIGFGVLLLASFVPTIQFGVLSAIIMFVNVLDDLFFLPALILVGDRVMATFRRQRQEVSSSP